MLIAGVYLGNLFEGILLGDRLIEVTAHSDVLNVAIKTLGGGNPPEG